MKYNSTSQRESIIMERELSGFKKLDEAKFRQKVASIVTKDLEKLNIIRLGYYEKFTSNVQYQHQLFNDIFVDDCIDTIVEATFENDDAYLSAESAKGFVNADIDYVAGFYGNIASDITVSKPKRGFADKIFSALCQYDLDKALFLLNNSDSVSVTISNVVEVIDTHVKPNGNGSHVTVPKKYLGRKVKLVILEE